MAEVTPQEAAEAILAAAPRNKGGQPKGGTNQARTVSQKAGAFTGRALKALWALADTTKDDKVKAACLVELLERAHGIGPVYQWVRVQT